MQSTSLTGSHSADLPEPTADQIGTDCRSPAQGRILSGAISSDSWAWVELNYRPHDYRAASYEHELGSEVLTRLPFTNFLLSISRIQMNLQTEDEEFARADLRR